MLNTKRLIKGLLPNSDTNRGLRTYCEHPALPLEKHRTMGANFFLWILVDLYFFFVWGLFTSCHLKSDGNATSGEKLSQCEYDLVLASVLHFTGDAGQMREYFSTLIRHIVWSRERACPYQEGCISFSINDRGDGYVPMAGRLYYDLNPYLTAFLIRWLFVKRLRESRQHLKELSCDLKRHSCCLVTMVIMNKNFNNKLPSNNSFFLPMKHHI